MRHQNQNLENTLKSTAFFHLLENSVIYMVKELMDTVAKTGIDATKTTSKKVFQETAEAIGNLIGNKRQQIIDGLKLLWA